MNYCEKIHYTILNTEPAEFAVMEIGRAHV